MNQANRQDQIGKTSAFTGADHKPAPAASTAARKIPPSKAREHGHLAREKKHDLPAHNGP
jgi:hypothetical protein